MHFQGKRTVLTYYVCMHRHTTYTYLTYYMHAFNLIAYIHLLIICMHAQTHYIHLLITCMLSIFGEQFLVIHREELTKIIRLNWRMHALIFGDT